MARCVRRLGMAGTYGRMQQRRDRIVAASITNAKNTDVIRVVGVKVVAREVSSVSCNRSLVPVRVAAREEVRTTMDIPINGIVVGANIRPNSIWASSSNRGRDDHVA